jgi:hypothetical protein
MHARKSYLLAMIAALGSAFGCEAIVGIEEVNFVEDDGTSDDAGRDSRAGGDAATTDAAVGVCKDEESVRCFAGKQPKGELCSDRDGGCTCAPDLVCVITTFEKTRVGNCCPADTACGEPGDLCKDLCDCRSRNCQSGRCK